MIDNINILAVVDLVTLLIYMVVAAGVSYGIMMLTRQKQEASRMSPENEFDVPSAKEGKPVAVLFGTKRVKGPNVVWYGDISTQAIKK